MVNLDEIGEKIKDAFSLDKMIDSLPMMLLVGGGLWIGSRVLDLGEKLEPVYNWVRRYNRDEFFEMVDTFADNMQFIEKTLKTFDIDLGNFDLKKVADFLQNVSAGGKWLAMLYDTVFSKFSKGNGGRGQKMLTHNSRGKTI
ncbi:hypothetical protein GF369_02225 [Candidatus Peregrinibacteria bacterium]|nr:hypothetical protein [Candidatus Peregrinibacteria bacterium]